MSIFSRELIPETPLGPYALERIEKEIAHLREKYSVRHRTPVSLTAGRFACALAVGTLLWLFFMDPFLYAWQKGSAMRAYVYLHNAGSDAKARELANSGILSDYELRTLEHRPAQLDAYPTPQAASAEADSIVHYMGGVYDLRAGKYDRLNPVGKLRYLLFVRLGIQPPTDWNALSPTVSGE